jgi:hypothetical protein
VLEATLVLEVTVIVHCQQELLPVLPALVVVTHCMQIAPSLLLIMVPLLLEVVVAEVVAGRITV